MLRTGGAPANPEIQQAIEDLLREDSKFDRTEYRSSHRDHLVRPVELELRDEDETIVGFSRNISTSGIGLIIQAPINDRTVAVLKITKLAENDLEVLAECRWCKPYGKNWFLTGWQFIKLKH